MAAVVPRETSRNAISQMKRVSRRSTLLGSSIERALRGNASLASHPGRALRGNAILVCQCARAPSRNAIIASSATKALRRIIISLADFVRALRRNANHAPDGAGALRRNGLLGSHIPKALQGKALLASRPGSALRGRAIPACHEAKPQRRTIDFAVSSPRILRKIILISQTFRDFFAVKETTLQAAALRAGRGPPLGTLKQPRGAMFLLLQALPELRVATSLKAGCRVMRE